MNERKSSRNILLVKNLPTSLSSAQICDLLQHFGASSVKYMGQHGFMKNKAFATYSTDIEAERALKLLHQLNVLGFTLSVEYSTNQHVFYNNSHHSNTSEVAGINKSTHESDGNSLKNATIESDKMKSTINFLSSNWDIPYCINEHLWYEYPPANDVILRNILHCLASVPKFYVQVLHLMNKMNLPAPFRELTLTPPISQATHSASSVLFESSDESELSSSNDDGNIDSIQAPKNINVAKRNKRKLNVCKTQIGKRMRSQLTLKHAQPAESRTDLSEVFERNKDTKLKTVAASVNLPTKISEVSLVDVNQEILAEPFGKFEKPTEPPFSEPKDDSSEMSGIFTPSGSSMVTPVNSSVVTPANSVITPANSSVVIPANSSMITPVTSSCKLEEAVDVYNETTVNKFSYITTKELNKGRLPEVEHNEHAALRNYSSGQVSSKLYIKNIAKQTTEDELIYIFGRYVDWNNPEESSKFDLRYMTKGRMKGQAFVTLPHKEAAAIAVQECHAYLLHDKPICVTFSKST